MVTNHYWRLPHGQVNSLYHRLLDVPHLLIAGATGSGKSVLINNLIYTLMYRSPDTAQLVLIDPKRVELIDYKQLPHTSLYATEIAEIADILDQMVYFMDYRYSQMQAQRVKQSNDFHVYVIIDEYADLMIQGKRLVENNVLRLIQLGRGANIHMIIATQRPTRDIITGAIKVNLDHRIALRSPTKQDSRNIIEVAGAEMLPVYGYGLYKSPMSVDMVTLPMTPQDEVQRLISHWYGQPYYMRG